MEFLIAMSKISPGFKLKSIQANTLHDAVLKVSGLILEYCSMNPFDFKVRSCYADLYRVEFILYFDLRRVTVLIFDPVYYPNADAAKRDQCIKSENIIFV